VRRSDLARRWPPDRRSVPQRRSTWTAITTRRRSRVMRRPRSRRRSKTPRRGWSLRIGSMLMASSRWHVSPIGLRSRPPCIPEATSTCRSRPGIALLGLKMPSHPTYGSDDVPKRCCGRVNEW